ncbi:hypothetical protein NCAS_0H01060 [Naumovozyma castellii]|uniref:Anaphase-promoting complex subunit 4 WD40 domain-containing protein n=1 Tax=Naumovozyma castellii TaxID=27288 RepID=G0VIT9_NAUCA|nr:hypothetical protein NCAS_0H01060 [Naumovozyma castellii CBS 4309]CCC71416.1 hypothetical protein NCAS_0H01060 [Naumovozyma castellii CBS 4309]
MKELAHYGPSLCVKFFKDFVVAGYGPFVQIYDYHNGKLLNKCRVFRKNKVHGLSINESGQLLAYGARSVTIVKFDHLITQVSLVDNEKMTTEWITSGEFNYRGDQVYLLTCYNKVFVCDLTGEILSRKTLQGERSILYSGSIKEFSPEKVYISAGTVMGGVLIWDLFLETKLYNLVGHEGSIFYATISDNGRYITSCSDDRSIKLWNLQTGEELCTGWGHTARIWNLKFFNNDTQLISVSEDNTCRVWDILQDEGNGNTSLTLSQIYEVHLIKNVWGVDIQEKDMVAVTSGNDGRLKLTKIQDTKTMNAQEVSFSLEDISTHSVIKFSKGEIIKGFQKFEFGLIAITSLGKIIQYFECDNLWKLLLVSENLVSYSVTHGIMEHNIVTFSNNKSDALLLKLSQDGRDIIAKKFMHLDELSKTNNCLVTKFDATTLMLTLESPNPRDKFICLQFDLETLSLKKKFAFAKPENFASSCLEVFENYILVGSRFSSIAIFDTLNIEHPAYMIRRISAGDTTTNIKFVETKGHTHLFSVTNRDGFYNFVALSYQNQTHQIIHSNNIVKGFLEGAYFNDNGEYITYGFKSNLFYIYNETNCYEIASQVCGGGHRQWKLTTLPDGGYMLVYIKAARLYMRKIPQSLFPQTLEEGMHGREIRDITILKDKRYHDDGFIFCTASEDTTIKVCHFNESTGKVTNHWTERKHVSGLQRCKFINGKYMISSSAREELFLWEINDDYKLHPFITIRQTLPASSDNPDLRIMDFDAIFLEHSDNFIISTVYSDSSVKLWYYNTDENKFHLLVKGRYQTCCILNTALIIFHDKLYLLIATTTGYLVTYDVTDHIPFGINETKNKLIDNKLETCCVDLPASSLSLRVHQSGIKAIDVFKDEHNDSFKIYSCGDDNAMAITLFKFDEMKRELNNTIVSSEPNSAASTVTSCNVFDNGRKLLSTSVDQVVKVWDVSNNHLTLQEEKYTTIADTGASDTVSGRDDSTLFLIGGIGFSVWKTD